MAEKFFNPDVKLHTTFGKDSLRFADEYYVKGNEFAHTTHCPYDRTVCRQKLLYLDDWMESMDSLNKGIVRKQSFCTRADMFHGCPVPELDCIRRHRYYQIIAAQQQKSK